MKSDSFLILPLLVALAIATALAPATSSLAGPAEESGKLTHIGLVWLKRPGNDADRQRLVDALHRFALEIPEVRSVSFGKPHGTSSQLVDSSFDLCFTLQFDDQAAMDRYAQHPVHQKAAEEDFLPLCQKILFYDYINEYQNGR